MDTASWSHRVQEQKASNNWNAPRLCNALRSSPVCVHGRGQQEPSQENQAQSQLCHLPHLQHFSQAFPLPRVSKTISRTWIHTVSKAECSCFQVAYGGSHHLHTWRVLQGQNGGNAEKPAGKYGKSTAVKAEAGFTSHCCIDRRLLCLPTLSTQHNTLKFP